MKFSEVNIYDLISYCNAYDDEKTKNEMKIKAKAKIINISGKEIQVNNNIKSEYSKRFIIRYPRGISLDSEDSKNQRLVYKNRSYDIIYISDVLDLNKYLEIVVKKES